MGAPTGKRSPLRAVLACAAEKDLELWQADITQAFLNGDQGETIYMQQAPGYDDKSGRVWRLRKALYGLRQAARAWHIKLREGLLVLGCKPNTGDPPLFVRVMKVTRQRCPIFTHVHDLLAAAPQAQARADMRALLRIFLGKDLGEARNALGLLLERNRAASLSQPQLVAQVLERHGMATSARKASPLTEGKPLSKDAQPLLNDSDKVQKYQAMVGSIQYLACITRSDLSFAAAQLARVMSCPTQEHRDAAKHVLRYLRMTSEYKLKLGGLP